MAAEVPQNVNMLPLAQIAGEQPLDKFAQLMTTVSSVQKEVTTLKPAVINALKNNSPAEIVLNNGKTITYNLGTRRPQYNEKFLAEALCEVMKLNDADAANFAKQIVAYRETKKEEFDTYKTSAPKKAAGLKRKRTAKKVKAADGVDAMAQ